MRKPAALAVAALTGLTGAVCLFASPIANGSGETETITVDAANANGATTSRALEANVTYTVTASGSYTWGMAGGTADAECSWQPPDSNGQANRLSVVYGNDDNFDVYVAGGKVDWQPASGAAADGPCDSNHSYKLAFKPATTGPVKFAVFDKTNSTKAGKITITVTAPAVAASEPSSSQPVAAPTTPKTRTPRVFASDVARPAAVAPAAPAPAVTPNRPLRGTTPVITPRAFTNAAQFREIAAPKLPDRPFHVTALGWLTIVVMTAMIGAMGWFVFATRADAVDSALRGALVTVMRTVVGGRVDNVDNS